MTVVATRFGRYELVEKIGEGGMAALWRARVTGPGGFARTIAVKRILPHLANDPAFVAMFLAEARFSARLSHANVVQVFECGEVDGEYFLAMEYIDGINLSRVVQLHAARKRTMAPEVAAYIAREVCRALAHVHALTDDDGRSLGLVHRDVTPSNVMIARDGAVKLLDFGIAKALDAASDVHTRTGVFKGKVGYASPELAEGESIDHRSDQFSVGVLLHEALAGRRLFKGASDLQTLALVRKAEITLPSQRNPSVPPTLDAICARSLARRRDDRFADCAEMADALDAVVRELGGSSRVVARMLGELVPNAATPVPAAESRIPVAAPAHDPPTVVDVPPGDGRLRSRWGALALIGALAVGGAGAAYVGLARTEEPAASSASVPSPAAAAAAPGSSAPSSSPSGSSAPSSSAPGSSPPGASAPVASPALAPPGATPQVRGSQPAPSPSRPGRPVARTPASKPAVKPVPAKPSPPAQGSGAPPDLKGGAIVDPFGGGSGR